MPKSGWSALYISVPTPLKDQIVAAAKAEDRSVAKWIEILAREHFATKQEGSPCSPSISSLTPHVQSSSED